MTCDLKCVCALLLQVRRIQRVKRKRRLERELTHQYSYPNSEAGDFDDEQRFLEVESIINTQFYAANDPEEKNFVAEIPQVCLVFFVTLTGQYATGMCKDSDNK